MAPKTARFLVLLVLAAPCWCAAQGLGDAARRERQKREQAAPAPAKTFTDADLEKAKPPAAEAETQPEAGAEDATPAPGEPGASEGTASTGDPALDALERERQERRLQEAEWRVRFLGAREQIALAEAACWREVVRTEFYQGVPVQMRVKEFIESEELRNAKQALADLEERFRRTGLPPGWARP